jgi:hypothetical protein
VNLNYVTRFNKTNELLVELSNGQTLLYQSEKRRFYQCDYSKEIIFSCFFLLFFEIAVTQTIPSKNITVNDGLP